MRKLLTPIAALAFSLALSACAPQVTGQPVPGSDASGAPAAPFGTGAQPGDASAPEQSPAGSEGGQATTEKPVQPIQPKKPSKPAGQGESEQPSGEAPSNSGGGDAPAGDTASTPKLPHEGQDGWNLDSEGAKVAVPACGESVQADFASGSRFLSSGGNEVGEQEAWITFESADKAQKFLDDVVAKVGSCPTSDGGDPQHRMENKARKVDVAGHAGVRVDSTLQMNQDGTWVPRPGGEAYLLAVQGNTVAFALEGGEGVVGPKDASTVQVIGRLRTTITKILA